MPFSLWKTKLVLSLQRKSKMVDVAQLVRASDCGSEGRRFEPGLPPLKKRRMKVLRFFIFTNLHLRHLFLFATNPRSC